MRLVPVACLLLLALCRPAAAREADQRLGFDYFLLALSWSPQYCARNDTNRGAMMQCGRSPGFGFVLHGLWPQNEDGSYPLDCRPSGPMPSALVARLLPVMPSEHLIRHEWTTHGSCSGLSARQFADSLLTAFQSLRIPPPLIAPQKPLAASAAEIKQLFVAANPRLRPDMMTIHCAGAAVSEIHICLDKGLSVRRCPVDQTDRCGQGAASFRPVR